MGAKHCAYAELFQPDKLRFEHNQIVDAPSPILLRWFGTPSNGDSFEPGEFGEFEIVFIGPAMDRIGLVVQALFEMSDEGPMWQPDFRIIQVIPGILPDTRRSWMTHDDFDDPIPPRALILRLATPWVGVPDNIDFRTLWEAVYRRQYRYLRAAFAPKMALPTNHHAEVYNRVRTSEVVGRVETWRFHTDPCQGWVGAMKVEGDLRPWWSNLLVAQLLHLGQKTGMGAGRLELEVIEN